MLWFRWFSSIPGMFLLRFQPLILWGVSCSGIWKTYMPSFSNGGKVEISSKTFLPTLAQRGFVIRKTPMKIWKSTPTLGWKKCPKPSKIVDRTLVKSKSQKCVLFKWSTFVQTQGFWGFSPRKNGNVLQTNRPNFSTKTESLGIRQFQDHHPAMTFTTTNLEFPTRHRRGGLGMFLKNGALGFLGWKKKKMVGNTPWVIVHSPKTNMVHLKMMVSQSRNLLFQVYHFQVNHVKLSEGNPWVFNFRKKGAFFWTKKPLVLFGSILKRLDYILEKWSPQLTVVSG